MNLLIQSNSDKHRFCIGVDMRNNSIRNTLIRQRYSQILCRQKGTGGIYIYQYIYITLHWNATSLIHIIIQEIFHHSGWFLPLTNAGCSHTVVALLWLLSGAIRRTCLWCMVLQRQPKIYYCKYRLHKIMVGSCILGILIFGSNSNLPDPT